MQKFHSIDLFSGVGGLSLGLEWAGFSTLFANEFDEEIGAAFQRNFPQTNVIIDDIRNIKIKTISDQFSIKNDVDLIVGGPPCQGFSMANRKRIEDDERNVLFLEYVRFVRYYQPKCFVIENVMGMNSEIVNTDSLEGNVSDAMKSYFNDLGYAISFRMFKSEEHGVPQMRRRVIVIGTRMKNKKDMLISGEIGNLDKEFYSKDDLIKNKKNIKQIDLFGAEEVYKNPITVWDAISDLPRLKSGQMSNKYDKAPSNDFQKYMRKGSENLHNHAATPHAEDVVQRIKLIKQGLNFESLPEELKTKSHHSGAWGRLEKSALSPTITTRFDTPSTGRVIHPVDHRTLTVREAARIQSFPDNFIFSGSRTSQGKQVGNSVPPLVALAVGRMIINDFLI